MTNQPLLSADGHFYWDGSLWRSLLSPDGGSLWNGSGWVPLGTPQASTTAAAPAAGPASQARSRGPLLAIGLAGLTVLGLVGYLVLSTLHPGIAFVSSGADSAAQFQSELRYRTVYARDVTAVRKDSVPFGATTTSPGVCNRGGSKQACFDTDARVKADLETLLRELDAVSTPQRYRAADADLKAGVRLTIEALGLRNVAIASGDANASFEASNDRFRRALALLQKAAAEYPADSRPEPSLL